MQPNSATSHQQTVSTLGLNAFAFESLRRLKFDGRSNIVYSPFSAFVAVASALSLFSGETQQEMLRALQSTFSSYENDSYAQKLVEIIRSEANEAVSTANNIWPNKQFEISKELLHTIQEVIGFNVTPVTFPQPACDQINEVVEKATRGMIKNLVSVSDVPPETVFAIVSAIYFSGHWKDPFDEAQNLRIGWTLPNGTKIDMNHMTLNGKRLNYAENDDFQVVSIPYKEANYVMDIVLPKSKENCVDILHNVTCEGVQTLLGSMSRRKVNVFLPKFEIEDKHELNDVFESLGMKKAFTPAAEKPSNINYYISKIMQKAKITVNEFKTEAAAATFMGIECCSLVIGDEPIYFQVDHPFLYTIRNADTSSLLFLGYVVNPNE